MRSEPAKIRVYQTFFLILPENIPFIKHRIISSYYNELKLIINNVKTVYPFEPYGKQLLIDNQWLCTTIGKLINSEVNWELANLEDLYYFFVLRIEGKHIKPSHLDLFLGISDKILNPEESEEVNSENAEIVEAAKEESELITTGDILLDVAASTLLNFKQGYKLLEEYSLPQLLAINKFASDSMTRAREEAKKEAESDKKVKHKFKVTPPKPAPQLVEDRSFVENKAKIADKIKAAGIPMPQNF